MVSVVLISVCLTRDRHRIRHLTDAQDNVHPQSRVRTDSLPRCNRRLETGQAGRDVICTEVETRDDVIAGIVGHRLSFNTGGFTFRTVTSTPGTTPPVSSVTVPLMAQIALQGDVGTHGCGKKADGQGH